MRVSNGDLCTCCDTHSVRATFNHSIDNLYLLWCAVRPCLDKSRWACTGRRIVAAHKPYHVDTGTLALDVQRRSAPSADVAFCCFDERVKRVFDQETVAV